MSGGGGGSSYRAPVQAAAPKLSPVPTADIQPNWGPQFGATATPNPYAAGNTPSWMNGWFGMPSWGMDPFGQPLTQEQMMYQRPQAFDDQMAAQNAPPPAPPPNPFAQQQQTPMDYHQRMYSGTMAGPEYATARYNADVEKMVNSVGSSAAQAMGWNVPLYALARESRNYKVNGDG